MVGVGIMCGYFFFVMIMYLIDIGVNLIYDFFDCDCDVVLDCVW